MTPEQNARSAALRTKRAAIRRQLHTGSVDLSDVLADPPECLHDLNLYEVIAMCRGMGRGRMADLGRAALSDRINLMVRVDSMGKRTAEWVGVRVLAPSVRGRRRLAVASRPVVACHKGHPFDDVNTYHRPDGRRECRTCTAVRKARWAARAAA